MRNAISRITSHEVKTNVYVDAVDLFTISTFSTQNSIDGGRGYIPVIGTIWRGIFQDIPGFGSLFSWKKDPQTVYHESLLLTNSYITPTVMGLALKYPVANGAEGDGDLYDNKKQDVLYENRKQCVKRYKNDLRSDDLKTKFSFNNQCKYMETNNKLFNLQAR